MASRVYEVGAANSLTKPFLLGRPTYYSRKIRAQTSPKLDDRQLAKRHHEFRDPIHTFIRVETAERDVIDDLAYQRLRNIHQLSLTYLLYPGATHKRFEHCLGVMELAGRVYDVVTDPANLHPRIRDQEFVHDKSSPYWQHYRTAVRMAALCHDLGHLPFSHGPEHLLPDDWTHERIGYEIIKSDRMKPLWKKLHVEAELVAKLSIGPKECSAFDDSISFSDWETILSEIITSNGLGVDRMDYLIRDSHHAGVAYGRFDHYRLIDTIRILPKDDESDEPFLGIDYGGLPSAEQMLLARYFMFTQVYFHAVRRVYDLHLVEFLEKWLEGGKFSIDLDKHQSLTDNEVLAAITLAAKDPAHLAHVEARRIVAREHFKVLWSRNPADNTRNIDAIYCVFTAAKAKFGADNVRIDNYHKEKGAKSFPVAMPNGHIADAMRASETLSKIPFDNVEFVFINRSCVKEALKWLEDHREKIIHPTGCNCKGGNNE